MKALLVIGLLWSAAAQADVGVTVDAGVPDGATAALVFRPVSRLRLHAGVSDNGISRGARGGITLAPLRRWFSPTLSFDYGRYVEGNANPLVQVVTRDMTFSSPVLERFGYSYANAHLGFEFGRRRATFYIHGGASYITTTLHGLDATSADGSTTVTFARDPDVALWSVSARVGLIVYIL